MKIVMISNYLNHHQLPICQELQTLTNGNFTFIATAIIPQQRVDLGYKSMNDTFDFVLCTYKSESSISKAFLLIGEADAVIIGSAPRILVRDRIRQGKLTFLYSERLFKKDYLKLLSPRAWYHQLTDNSVLRKNKLYLLCSSAFASKDYSLFLSYINKAYKWGYFPEAKHYDNIDELIESKQRSSILWVARLIDWKHPEIPLLVAKRLKSEGYHFCLNMIGIGEMYDSLKQMIIDKDLEDCVNLLGSMPPDEVRKNMEKSEIFLFTSDRNEGWGAVLNEAMNSACAVVAGSAIGSVPFLINNGVNGFIYNSEDIEDLYKKIKILINDSALRSKIATNAYATIQNDWCPHTAAMRFLEMVRCLNENSEFELYKEGPCSRAERIRDNWYKNEKNK